MTKPILDCPGVVAGVRQRVAAAVAKHMRTVEMRNILKASSKCDFRNLPVSRIVEQITRAGRISACR